jgi:alpha-D-xyloside xylohydrolase
MLAASLVGVALAGAGMARAAEPYRYEKGEYATVPLAWDEARRTLRIGAREGGFPGMTKQRTLKVRLMPSRPGGRIQTKTVHFDGEPVELRFTP